MNWRRGFFCGWALISIIWAIGWGIIVLPDANEKVAVARMSNPELMAQRSSSNDDEVR